MIDPNIYQGLRVPQTNPFEQMGQMLSLRQMVNQEKLSKINLQKAEQEAQMAPAMQAMKWQQTLLEMKKAGLELTAADQKIVINNLEMAQKQQGMDDAKAAALIREATEKRAQAGELRAQETHADARAKAEQERADRLAQESAGTPIPGSDFTSNTGDKMQWFRVRQADGSYKNESRSLGKLGAAPAAPQAPMTPERFQQEQTLVNTRAQATAENKPPKPPTGAERTAFKFWQRAENALKDIETVEDQITNMGGWKRGYLTVAPYLFQTQTGKTYHTARQQFTEARLRKDSGAAIQPFEYANDERMYFAQPGDTKETLEQKRRARKVVLDSLKGESGRAYDEHFGVEDVTPPTQRGLIVPGGALEKLLKDQK